MPDMEIDAVLANILDGLEGHDDLDSEVLEIVRAHLLSEITPEDASIHQAIRRLARERLLQRVQQGGNNEAED